MSDESRPAVDESVPDDETLSAAEQEELVEEIERRRSLRGVAAVVVAAVAVLFSLFQMWLAARGPIFAFGLPLIGEITLGSFQLLQTNAIHVAFALVLAFLVFPPTTGDGRVSKRFARVVPAIRRRAGADSSITRVGEAVRAGVRWAVMDDERERVTPLDIVLIVLTGFIVFYMISDFDEIQQLRALGLDSGRTVGEVFPLFAPVASAVSAIGIPLDSTSYAFVLGVLGVLFVIEATRRALGTPLTAIAVAFVAYAKYGFLIPQNAAVVGVFSIPQSDWATIIQNFWYNTENGVFGIPVTVSVQFIYIFILFGAFLEMSGAGQWFIDLAYSLTGDRRGGPAKASILASGFMGTISGSSIANTVTTGAFTIPLMKRSGYRPVFAGAVEASSSTGGQILPPVMGAAAFLIVQYTGIPYADVIVAATVPAIVFFFGVWVMVHFEALRVGIGGDIDEEARTNVGSHLRKGWFYLVPIVLLLYYLIVVRLSVARSAWYTLVAIAAVIAVVAADGDETRPPLVGGIVGLALAEFASHLVTGTGIVGALTGGAGGGTGVGAAVAAIAGDLGWIAILVSMLVLLWRPYADSPYLDLADDVDRTARTLSERANRPRLADNGVVRYSTFLFSSMESGARTATTVVVAVAVVGIIPGVLSSTGLAANLAVFIETVGGGSIVILLVVTAIAAIVLGMGVPTTATYILLVAVLGQAIRDFGVPLLAAHLFILYFGVIADITPPVAVAAYAASGIAKSDQFQTGVQAFSLSLNKAIVPFAFVLTPGIILLRGSGENAHVISLADVADLGFFVPQVLIPIACVFVGVIALGATIIGYFYSDVTRVERALFALAAFLLMVPSMLTGVLVVVLASVGVSSGFGDSLGADLALRALGVVLFGALALRNRGRVGGDRERSTPTGGAIER